MPRLRDERIDPAALTAACLWYFVDRVSAALHAREGELSAAREAALRTERVAALADFRDAPLFFGRVDGRFADAPGASAGTAPTDGGSWITLGEGETAGPSQRVEIAVTHRDGVARRELTDLLARDQPGEGIRLTK